MKVLVISITNTKCNKIYFIKTRVEYFEKNTKQFITVSSICILPVEDFSIPIVTHHCQFKITKKTTVHCLQCNIYILVVFTEKPYSNPVEHNVQSTLVISTSVISNNRLSRRKNLVLVITQKSKIRL